MKSWLLLVTAIFCEVLATTSLKLSEGFTKMLPSSFVIIGYAASFYFLSLTLKTIPVSTAYAIWSGLGIVIVASISGAFFGQKPDLWGVIGMTLIIAAY
ncbi:quaternary ammonium compound efflux SMR transporter QacE delta 1 [Sessilibacter sp. MAH4]